MDNNIELSFCIPTYNNASSIFRLVSDILTYQDSNIEVVVLDNGSTDETLNILRTISDIRLQVYTNGENKGALFNMVNVLNKGKGKYLVYSTDHDHIDYEKISKFKTFLLKNPEISCGYCEYNSKLNSLFDSYPVGYIAVNALAYITRHPTGYFFKNEHLKSIEIVKRFSDYEYVDLFPLEFVFGELCLLGDGAVYYDSIFTPETGIRVVKHKSATTNGNSKRAFFSPETRLKLAINFKNHICSLPISENEKGQLMLNSFLRELSSATFGYKNVMRSVDLCTHYYMECREIGQKELFSIGINFYKEYSNKVIKEHFKSLLPKISFKMKLFTNILLIILRLLLVKILLLWRIKQGKLN